MELAFGYTTDSTLHELANLDQPLLRRLMLEAPEPTTTPSLSDPLPKRPPRTSAPIRCLQRFPGITMISEN
ncbi:MAG: hypothetical protein R2860_07250 [Desulfobacterales bacterium]